MSHYWTQCERIESMQFTAMRLARGRKAKCNPMHKLSSENAIKDVSEQLGRKATRFSEPPAPYDLILSILETLDLAGGRFRKIRMSKNLDIKILERKEFDFAGWSLWTDGLRDHRRWGLWKERLIVTNGVERPAAFEDGFGR